MESSYAASATKAQAIKASRATQMALDMMKVDRYCNYCNGNRLNNK
jgi:hypothetical protein